jgi:hypothetical protein
MKIIIKNPCLLALLSFIASLPLLSMEKDSFSNQFNELNQSTITCITTTEQGLGWWFGVNDTLYGEPQATATALEKNHLPINNVSTYNKVNRSIEALSCNPNKKENTDLLIRIISLCRQGTYKGYLGVNNLPFIKAHDYLTGENKQLQSQLQTTIKQTGYDFTSKINSNIEVLKDLIKNTVNNIKTIDSEHTTKRNSIIKNECDEMRKIKEALFNLHRLNAGNSIPHNTKPSASEHYCSDSEKEISNIPKSYSDEYIIKNKISLDKTINSTTIAVQQLLTKLEAINILLNKISAL